MDMQTQGAKLPPVRTPSIVSGVRADHGPADETSSVCRICGQLLPCDALVLAREVTQACLDVVDFQNETTILSERAASVAAGCYRAVGWMQNVGWTIAIAGVVLAPGSFFPSVSDLTQPLGLKSVQFYSLGYAIVGSALVIKGMMNYQIDAEPDRLWANGRILIGAMFLSLVAAMIFSGT